MNKKFKMIADGYCGKCDYEHMVRRCELVIYDGEPEAGYTLYCQNCGSKVDFDQYYERISEETIAVNLELVIKSVKDDKCGYFNEEYIRQRIEICKRVILTLCPEFEEYVWAKQCNPYLLMEITRNLYDLMEILEQRESNEGKRDV